MTKAYFKWTRSLRFRLTASYSGAIAVVIILAAILLFLSIQHSIVMETDTFLAGEANHIAQVMMNEPYEADHLEDIQHAIDSSAANANIDQSDPSLPPRLTLFNVVYARVLSQTGVIATSHNLTQHSDLIPALDSETPLQRALTHAHFSFAGPDEEREMRVFTESVSVNETHYVLQVAVPWDHNSDLMERAAILIALSVPVLVALIAIVSWTLVGRTLQPIQRIVTEVEALDADALPEALLPKPAETDSEIGRLVATLNRMTTRLHDAFAARSRFAEAQQRFAADASHELRTPLTILRGEIDLALSRFRSPDEYQKTLGSALEEIDRMTRIVEGLSFLARRDAAQITIDDHWKPVDLSQLGHEVVEEFGPKAANKQIELSFHLELGTDGIVLGDHGQLHQLLRNLVDNAIKYTPADGQVSVSGWVEEETQERVIAVKDNGIGIRAEDLPHVFERFWRADQSRSTPGTGLGLAISQQIAEVHHGSLIVESTFGQGTCFCLTLPSLEEGQEQNSYGPYSSSTNVPGS